MSLLDSHTTLKPMKYLWAYEAWMTQQKVHWLADEIPMSDDVKDWVRNINDSEKNLLTQIFRFFTQSDTEVANNYNMRLIPVIKPVEVIMMLTAFSNIETIHVHAYSYLLDTVGMPESEYQAFFQYSEMKEKYEYYQTFSTDTKEHLAETLAAFGAFVEGVQLFASFAILLSFPRRGLMKGMGQIITYSIRDETLHCNNIIKLFRTFIEENPGIWTPLLQSKLYDICKTMVHHEDAFIDLAFEQGDVEGLTSLEVKEYIRYIADRRLIQLGLNKIYNYNKNPLPWIDEMVNAIEHSNFFETRSTEYSRSSTTGTWDEAFE